MGGWCYILTDRPYGTLYTGVTSDLPQRAWQHREGVADGFSLRYGLKKLVWFEFHDRIEDAIQREKLIKRWRRVWKYELIEKENPDWRDLYDELNR